jgi:hypothetical protein
MPEDFVDPKDKKSKWRRVENKELGTEYLERVIKLSDTEQKEYGMKRIRCISSDLFGHFCSKRVCTLILV